MTDGFIGYFEGTAPGPTHDPGLDVACLIDQRPLQERPRVTVSLAPIDGARSLFFRVHKDCWEGLTDVERFAYESSVIDAEARRV